MSVDYNRAYQQGFQDGFCRRHATVPGSVNDRDWRDRAIAYARGFRDGGDALVGPYEHEVIMSGDRIVEVLPEQLPLL